MYIYAELRAIWLEDYINDDYIEAHLSNDFADAIGLAVCSDDTTCSDDLRVE